MAPLISVIMLTCDRQDMVGRAIESVLAQTLQGFEFIIVNNGSADHSGEIAEEYAQRDARIRVLHTNRKGSIGYGRNQGLAIAKGQYITFIDDDDWVEPDFLEFLYSLILENKAEIAICGSFGKRSSDKKMLLSGEEAVVEMLRRKYFNTGFPTKLFSRELIGEFRFPEQVFQEDPPSMYRLLVAARRVAYHGLPKYIICRHDGNTTRQGTINPTMMRPELLMESSQNYHDRALWLSQRFPHRAAEFRYYEWSFYISMVERVSRLNLQGCEESMRFMRRELAAHAQEFLNCEWVQDFEKKWMGDYLCV